MKTTQLNPVNHINVAHLMPVCLQSLTKLYGTEYKVTTGAVLDREEQDQYSVAIICTDFGEDPQVRSQCIVIL